MSSSSWRQYGGRSIVVKDTINVGTVIANQFLTRTTSSITNTFENVNILGELIVGYDSTIGRRLFVLNDQYNYSNIYLKNKLLFGTTSLSVDPNYAYITGDQYNIGINTLTPSTVFHITGHDPTVSDILTIDTQSSNIRNIIGQNVNKKGLVITANDTSSNIFFYNDYTTAATSPDAFIKYSIGNNLTLNTQNNINVTSNNVNLQFNEGSANFNQTDISINTPGNITSTSKSIIFYNYKKDASNSSIKIDASGVTLKTTDNVFMYSNNNIFLNTIITEISSNLVVSRNGIYNNIYGETTTIYDSSNSYYLSDIYDNSFSSTGNALTLVAVDTSSNTTARIIAPNNIGLLLQGGVFVNDTSRSFAAISLSDISQNNILNQTILSGKDPVKYYSTTGINTYSPKTENYVLDINGPTRIGNGEINITSIPNFEITLMKFSKKDPMSGIAVGTPITSFELTNYLNQFILYTKDGGITWNISNVGGIKGSISRIPNNTFTSLYVYNQYFSIIGTKQNNLFYTYDGGINWYSINYEDTQNSLNYRHIKSIIINDTSNPLKYLVTTVFNFTESTHNFSPGQSINDSFFNIFDIDLTNFSNNQIIKINPVDTLFCSNTTITSGDVGKKSGSINNYFVGNGIFYLDKNTNIFTQIPNTNIIQDNSYNDIYVIDDLNYVAVGNNLIYTSSNNFKTVINISNIIGLNNINLRSVFLYDLSLGVAVGDNGVFLYTTMWSIPSSWNTVPYNLLNSSGIANRITNKNLRGIAMRDINTFIIPTIIQPYDLLLKQLGKSQLLLCFLPNLLNCSNNKVFDVSGNMVISGDININDGGQLLSNNKIFNAFINSPTVQQIYLGNNKASTAINGNLYTGGDVSFNQRLYVVNDTSLNTRLFVGGDVSFNSRLTVYNDVSLNTRLFVGGDVSLNSRLTVYNDVSLNTRLFVGGDVSLNSRLTVYNDVSFNMRLFVGGDVSLNSRLTVYNDVSFNTRLFVGGDVSFNSRLTVYNDVSFNTRLFVGGDVSFNSRLTVYNDVSFNNRLFVGGDVSFNSRLTVYNDVSFNTRIFVGGDVSFNSRLTVYNDVSFNTRLFVGGDVSFNSRLTVYNDVSFNTRLFVGGDVSFNSRLTVYNDVSFNTRLFVGGDVSFNSRLTVYNDVSFNTRLFIGGDVSINGNVIINKDILILGRLSVQQYTSQNIINTTTTNYTFIVAEDFSLNNRLFVGSDVSFNSRLTVYNDVSFNTRLFVGGDVSFNSNFYVDNSVIIKNDTTIKNRLFIIGDVSLNGGNLIVLNKKTIFCQNFDNSNNNLYNNYFDACGMYFGINSTSINIGSYGVDSTGTGKNPVPTGKVFTIGSGGYSGKLSNANTIYIGSTGDNIYINGNTIFQNQDQTQYNSPLLQLNCPSFNTITGDYNYPVRNPGATFNSDNKTISTLKLLAGISIANNSDNYSGLIVVSNDSNGYYFKAPSSPNIVNLNIGSLTLPQNAIPQQQALTSSQNISINNGILVLTTDTTNRNYANYGIKVNPIDISNIFLRDITSTTTYQQVLTNVGISGDFTVMLNNRLMVYSDVSFNSRLYVYSDASFCNRVFVCNDVSLNANLFVANISTLSGPIYQF